MDVSDENMTSKEMLEKVAELDHSRSQLKLRNTEMRHLLDAADDEMTVLRSENEALRKQVKTLEQMIVDVQHVEAQPFRLPLGDDLYLKQSTKFRQQELVGDGKEHNAMMEQNKNLIAEVQRFQEQREKDMMSLSKFSVALKNSEFRTEEAQIGLQQRDEVIQQNKLQLKQAEETIEEYSSIIKFRVQFSPEVSCDLRLVRISGSGNGWMDYSAPRWPRRKLKQRNRPVLQSTTKQADAHKPRSCAPRGYL
ncbi:uncharacterized protein LOC133484429 isoform X8 [Phyllopteryx taeniolatus]|uniref:uncharacterized protein LOC133484429 isoform X8 n=1 Tax=Phyllopteryx taeniolatus TaxID=161469 RepID=UPI002AD4696D|nr:uncharacterized protein LOC133484429 isoform X8 [Phyllopteryx taeniolatus]